jgi:hypothetical protein
MHDSRNTTVLISIPSMPIIEHCTNIIFGLLPPNLLHSPLVSTVYIDYNSQSWHIEDKEPTLGSTRFRLGPRGGITELGPGWYGREESWGGGKDFARSNYRVFETFTRFLICNLVDEDVDWNCEHNIRTILPLGQIRKACCVLSCYLEPWTG